jgi:MFS family permease
MTNGYRRYVLALLVMVFALNFMDRQILVILIEPIRQEFRLSDTQLGFLSGFAFAALYTTLGIPLARWADRGVRTRLITLSLATFSAMTVLCAMAGSFWQLVLARIGVGVGEAGTNAPSHSLIADLYGPQRRVTAMATFAVGAHLGLVLALAVGGLINHWYGWRAAFIAAGVPGLLLAPVVHLTLRELPRGQANRLVPEGRTTPPVSIALRFMWSQPAPFVGRRLARQPDRLCYSGYRPC